MLLLVVVVLAALALIAIGQFARRIVDRGRAQTAADAAALAGTTGGQLAAVRLAADNGAHLLSYRQRGDEVTVVVEFHGQQAAARATDGP
jgi:outer membrane lipoprotein SlyB